jgi:hypothetical protein
VLTSSFTPPSLSSPARRRRAAEVGNGENRRARMARRVSLQLQFVVRSARGRSECLSLVPEYQGPVNPKAHNGAFSSQENAGTKRPRQSTCETEGPLNNSRKVVVCC